jgi:uncharacterized membrane protein YccC
VVLVASAGTDPVVLWIALPVTTAIAAFAPRAWSFAAGQAAFTLMVCIVFNLIHPVGWRIGIVRAEDIAVGAAVSLVAGALLWPRGPAAMVADNIARLVRASTRYLEAAAEQCLGEGTITRAVRSRAISATTHVDDGLPALLDSPRRPDGTEPALTSLLGTTTLIRLTGHSLAVAVPTPRPVPAEVRGTVHERLRRLTTWFGIVAGHLVGGPAATTGPGRDPRIDTPEGPWAHWVELHLDLLAEHLEGVDASAGTLAAARRAWS